MNLHGLCLKYDKMSVVEDYINYKFHPKKFLKKFKEPKIHVNFEINSNGEYDIKVVEKGEFGKQNFKENSSIDSEEEELIEELNINQKAPKEEKRKKEVKTPSIKPLNNTLVNSLLNSMQKEEEEKKQIKEKYKSPAQTMFNFKDLKSKTQYVDLTSNRYSSNQIDSIQYMDYSTSNKGFNFPSINTSFKVSKKNSKCLNKSEIKHNPMYLSQSLSSEDPFYYKSDPLVKLEYLNNVKDKFARNFKFVADNMPDVYLEKYGTKGEIVDFSLLKMNKYMDFKTSGLKAKNLIEKDNIKAQGLIHKSDQKEEFGRITKYMVKEINRRDKDFNDFITIQVPLIPAIRGKIAKNMKRNKKIPFKIFYDPNDGQPRIVENTMEKVCIMNTRSIY